MRLILSRKGFDSSAACGGCASPILPDGQMISLPIPHASGRVPFTALRPRGHEVGQLVSDLTRGRVKASSLAHLDPDLEPSSRARAAGWRPAFGQDGIAQRHLDRMGVGPGDLFLFFGWFRRVKRVRGRYQYEPQTPDRHVIFGWLRVGRVLRLATDTVPGWLQDHPHVNRLAVPHNTIYVARGVNGSGVFPTFHETRCLTEAGSRKRSVWHLPADFLPGARRPLTYHGALSRWTATDDGCRLRSVAKGQEFVLDLDDYPGVRRWLDGVFSARPRRSPR